VISNCDVSQNEFIEPKKGLFLEMDDAVFTYFSSEMQDRE
jgi:hypothetical protein